MPTEYTDKDDPHRRDDDEPTRDQKGNRKSRAIVALKDAIRHEDDADRQRAIPRRKKYGSLKKALPWGVALAITGMMAGNSKSFQSCIYQQDQQYSGDVVFRKRRK